jgi:hypothetical protein
MKSLAHPAHLSTRETRALELYRTHHRDIERSEADPDVYLVPSQDGKRTYEVDYFNETCNCSGHNFHPGMPCKHIICVGIHRAKRRARRASCAGCGDRQSVRELIELHEDNHDNLTYFHGDKLCRSCAEAAGVSY